MTDIDVKTSSGHTRLGDNCGLFRQRHIAGILHPRSVMEVRQLAHQTVESGGPALHVFSTGRNWGLGSREPAQDDSLVLDLSGLDQIRTLDVDAGWAVIEPGVTQGQLATALDGTTRMINVTSSSARSSVLGNALDRGVGLRHQRVEDLMGLEVVLPGGEIAHVGWWPRPDVDSTAVYPHGRGPSLVQLFVQSDLAIVTAAAVRLLPRPEALQVLRLTFPPDHYGQAVDLLQRWVAQGMTRAVLKIYNPPAARGYGNPPGMFLAHVCVDGTGAAVSAITGLLVAEARAAGIFTEVSATDSADPTSPYQRVTALVERSYLGDPDVTDAVFEQKVGYSADELDDHLGFLFFMPLVPFTAPALLHAEDLLAQVATETGVTCGGTLNVLGPDVVDLAISLRFDRRAPAVAHRALDRLHELFIGAGFLPYRLDIDHHGALDRCAADPAALDLARQIKRALDPQGVLAPGRYR